MTTTMTFTGCKEYVELFAQFKMPPYWASLLRSYGANYAKCEELVHGFLPKRACFQNASHCIKEDPDLIYCEGLAVAEVTQGIPLDHAWLVDRVTGTVIDPTWSDGVEYFGICFDSAFVWRCLCEIEVYGLLPNLYLLARRRSLEQLDQFFAKGILPTLATSPERRMA